LGLPWVREAHACGTLASLRLLRRLHASDAGGRDTDSTAGLSDWTWACRLGRGRRGRAGAGDGNPAAALESGGYP
jgi:hypothetical protein